MNLTPASVARALLWTCLLIVAAGRVAAEEVGLLELFNYYEYSPELMSSGQPTREQFSNIAAAGVEAVINLAPVDSPGALADEGEVVRGLGMAYHFIPVNWDAPPAADVDKFFAAMDSLRGRRVLVHCYANARASAFVYLWRAWRAGHDRMDAFTTMTTIWGWNEGYDYPNVPQWQALVAEISRRHAKQPHAE